MSKGPEAGESAWGFEELKRGEKDMSKVKKGNRGVRSGLEGGVTGIRSGQTLQATAWKL